MSAMNTAQNVFDAWVTGVEATLKATSEYQNASLAAVVAMLKEWRSAVQRATPTPAPKA